MQIRMAVVGIICAVGLSSCAPVPATKTYSREKWVESIKVNILGMPRVPNHDR